MIVDGAAWLKELEAKPETVVLLPHDEAVALARSLAGMQAMAAGQRRMTATVEQLRLPV